MNTRINEIEWSEPILPRIDDPAWEKIVKKQMGVVPDVLTRVSSNDWLRVMTMRAIRVQDKGMPRHLVEICTLVCAQENACRFCFGVARSQMKFFGYSNEMINGVEQDMLMAELDQKDRTFIRFCRSLARSNPRPPKTERDKLLKLGFSHLEVSEMAFHIARECFVNRVVTFISSPPMIEFERLSGSIWGWILRPLIARNIRTSGYKAEGPLKVKDGPFMPVIQALDGVPAAAIFQDGIEGAFNSKVLSKELKVLMIAVVARSLGCSACHDATCKMAYDLGLNEEEFSQSLSTLSSPRLNEQENMILSWTRETIHYQPRPMQSSTKTLAQTVDQEVLLEAIGVAALANSIVRLAILLD